MTEQRMRYIVTVTLMEITLLAKMGLIKDPYGCQVEQLDKTASELKALGELPVTFEERVRCMEHIMNPKAVAFVDKAISEIASMN